MKTRVGGLLGLVGMVMLFSPAAARAEGTACGTPTVIVPDGRITTSSIPNGSTFFFSVATTAGRSYSVEFATTDGITPPGTLSAFNDVGCSVAQATTDTTGMEPKVTLGARRVSFTATTAQVKFSLQNATGGAVAYSFNAAETTMFSPSWSTNGTYNTYYSLMNTTSTVITGQLILRDTTGTVRTTENVSINPGATAARNTAPIADGGMGTQRSLTGTATFTHNGPPNAVLAQNSTANFTTSPPYVSVIKFEAVRAVR